MDKQEISQKIKEIIAEICERDLSEIKDNANLVEDLEVDSLAALEILATMEKEFKIKIPEEDLAKFATVDQIIAVAEEKLKIKA